MGNVKNKYWTEVYDTITNYNDRNHTPLFNANIKEVIDKAMLEGQLEAKNAMLDALSPQRKEGGDLIKKSRIWQ